MERLKDERLKLTRGFIQSEFADIIVQLSMSHQNSIEYNIYTYLLYCKYTTDVISRILD